MGALMLPSQALGWAALALVLLSAGGGDAKTCSNRRCLAEMLINKNFSSQPQYRNCTRMIRVPMMEYQTLSVDTKNLRLISQLLATLMWNDPELGWDTDVYPYDQVVLPVSKVWTPELHVTNGILTTMQHASRDLLAYSNGTIRHKVILNAEVNCEVNLFNYPFAADDCPVAIQTWSVDGCGTELVLGHLRMVDSTHGDWQTESVSFQKQRDDRNYIMVSLRIKATNPFITLQLPSILIVLADMVSFALPLGGGERNSFKVTLVLSFTMFLIILNDKLPGDSQCSPIIRVHFCICLVLLVLSMLVSLVLTRVAKDGGFIFCCCPKRTGSNKKRVQEDNENEELKADISVVQLSGAEESNKLLRQVVNFLQTFETNEVESERRQSIANTLDQTFFWFYFILGTIYFCAMNWVMVRYTYMYMVNGVSLFVIGIGDVQRERLLQIAGSEDHMISVLSYEDLKYFEDVLVQMLCSEVKKPIDLCNPNPCMNDGICLLTGTGSFRCQCRGFEGPHCETRSRRPSSRGDKPRPAGPRAKGRQKKSHQELLHQYKVHRRRHAPK